MTTKRFPRHGVTVQNGRELIALSASAHLTGLKARQLEAQGFSPSASKLPSICGCRPPSLLRGQFLAKSATTDFRSAERIAEVDGYGSVPL